MPLATRYICIDCGGRCVLVTHFEDGYGPEVGDIVTYRCLDCWERFDVEVAEDDVTEEPISEQ